MGTFRYPIVLCSRDGTWERRVDALVDTGATYTWVPRPILEELATIRGQVLQSNSYWVFTCLASCNKSRANHP